MEKSEVLSWFGQKLTVEEVEKNRKLTDGMPVFYEGHGEWIDKIIVSEPCVTLRMTAKKDRICMCPVETGLCNNPVNHWGFEGHGKCYFCAEHAKNRVCRKAQKIDTELDIERAAVIGWQQVAKRAASFAKGAAKLVRRLEEEAATKRVKHLAPAAARAPEVPTPAATEQ